MPCQLNAQDTFIFKEKSDNCNSGDNHSDEIVYIM